MQKGDIIVPKTSLSVRIPLALLMVLLATPMLNACSSQPAIVPTSLPPSRTSIPPTITPTTIPLTASPTYEPEFQATKKEDIIGVWLMISSTSDPMYPAKWRVDYTLDGTRIATIVGGNYSGLKILGKYWFEDCLYKAQLLDENEDLNSTSIGIYRVYVTKQAGRSVQLRFVVVDDPYVLRRIKHIFQPLTILISR